MVESGWQDATMGEVMAEFFDGPHATPPPADEGPIYLGIKNLTEGGHLDLTDVRHIAEADYPKWIKRVEPRAGDIVFTYEATLHRYAMIPEGFRGSLGRRVALIRPNTTRVNSDYLYYYLLSPQWRRVVEQRINIGSTVDRIPLTEFPSFPLSIAPRSAQKAIAQVLRNFDRLIENNRRRIEILEEMARLIYREWFVHFRFPGHEDVELVDSALGPIPAGWEVGPFSELAEFVNGFAFKPAHHFREGLPIVKIKELKNGVSADTPRNPGAEVPKRFHIDDGDVLFSWSADLDAYLWSSGPALLNQHLFHVRPKRLPELFLFHSLRARMGDFRVRAQGTTMRHIKRSALTEVVTVVPPDAIVGRFERIVAPVMDLQLNLTRQNRVLAEARDLLLPRLISGELDVSDLDLDVDLPTPTRVESVA